MQTTELDPSQHELDSLGDLTRRYARFSRNAGGLGTALGGALALATYLSASLSPLGPVPRTLIALLPFAWVAGKETLRLRMYQRLGRVTELKSPAQEGWHRFFTLFYAVISVFIFMVVAPKWFVTPSWAGIAYISLVVALPIVVWRYLWTVEEYLIGPFLFIQGALLASGGGVAPTGFTPPLIWCGIAIVIGVIQHFEFLRIEASLTSARRVSA